jgi:hypothetical protein
MVARSKPTRRPRYWMSPGTKEAGSAMYSTRCRDRSALEAARKAEFTSALRCAFFSDCTREIPTFFS